LADSKLIIIGYSLSDQDIKDIISQAITLNSQALSAGRIALLMYQADPDRAALWEGRGLEVVFAGIDEFFAEMGRKSPGPLFSFRPSDDYLEQHPVLVPTTLDTSHEVEAGKPELSRMFNGWMFNGWPATYADIENKQTFERTISDQLANHLSSGSTAGAVLLGASGVDP
jgi:hypothetical protein